jgi:RNA polymerase sigma-70 factor, ECF subfamily
MYAHIFKNELEPHSDALFTFAMRHTADASKAEDLVQETFIRAWVSIEKYQSGTNPKAWLFKICYNLFVNSYRSLKNQPQKVDIDDLGKLGNMPVTSVSAAVNPDGDIYGDEVFMAVSKINENYRTLFLLFLDGFSYAEMAEITNTELNTVRTRLKRAKDALFIYLKDYAKNNGFDIDE